jgi:hypothetical protein
MACGYLWNRMTVQQLVKKTKPGIENLLLLPSIAPSGMTL